MPTPCQHYANIIQSQTLCKVKHYANIRQTLCKLQTLHKHYANIMQILCKYYANIMQTLRNPYVNLTETLHKHYTSIMQTSHKHYANVNVTQTLHCKKDLPLVRCGSIVDLLEGIHCMVESLPPPKPMTLLSTPPPATIELNRVLLGGGAIGSGALTNYSYLYTLNKNKNINISV